MELERVLEELEFDRQTLEKLRLLQEREREYKHRRQAEGIARAKERGVRFGRPKVQVRNLEHVYELYISNQISVTDASKISGIARSTIYRKLREYQEQTTAAVSKESRA